MNYQSSILYYRLKPHTQGYRCINKMKNLVPTTLNQVIGKKVICFYNKENRCIQQLTPELFDTAESAIEAKQSWEKNGVKISMIIDDVENQTKQLVFESQDPVYVKLKYKRTVTEVKDTSMPVALFYRDGTPYADIVINGYFLDVFGNKHYNLCLSYDAKVDIENFKAWGICHKDYLNVEFPTVNQLVESGIFIDHNYGQ